MGGLGRRGKNRQREGEMTTGISWLLTEEPALLSVKFRGECGHVFETIDIIWHGRNCGEIDKVWCDVFCPVCGKCSRINIES